VTAQPGEVHFTWLQPAAEGEALLSPLCQQAVEVAARAVAAAAAQEVQHTGFGKHTLVRWLPCMLLMLMLMSRPSRCMQAWELLRHEE